MVNECIEVLSGFVKTHSILFFSIPGSYSSSRGRAESIHSWKCQPRWHIWDAISKVRPETRWGIFDTVRSGEKKNFLLWNISWYYENASWLPDCRWGGRGDYNGAITFAVSYWWLISWHRLGTVYTSIIHRWSYRCYLCVHTSVYSVIAIDVSVIGIVHFSLAYVACFDSAHFVHRCTTLVILLDGGLKSVMKVGMMHGIRLENGFLWVSDPFEWREDGFFEKSL